jgi:myo-inositol-1(or 4)-monophosphatase
MTRLEGKTETDQRIAAAKDAVMAQTDYLQANFGRARSEIKHDGTKVTAVDLAISEQIQTVITARFPGDQFFSEELAPTTGTVPISARYCWVLDPIDGTNNYINGIIYCAISLALLEHGVPVYGVIYDLARRVLIHGGPGRGLWVGEKPVAPRGEAPNGHSLIGFHSPVDKGHAAEGKKLIENFKIRGLGSSTLHLAYAATGLLDGVMDHNNKVWDIAAACALCAEAGIEIHYLENPPFPLREFSVQSKRIQYVAGAPAMVRRLREVIGR